MEGKTVILGITGSIAAYKMAYVASALAKQRCDVHVIMTKNATEFIAPLTFESLTNNRCITDTFDRNFSYDVHHVSLAKRADLFLIAPASADIIAKCACGIADDMLTTTLLACTCKKMVAPAMNTNMYRNPIVQTNLDLLRSFDFEVIPPATGMLACKDVGEGKMPEPEVLLSYIEREICCEKDLRGKKILVTAGPTQEALDPVRYLTNHSSGKMGYAIAKAAMLRGAAVTLVTGPTSIEPPRFVNTVRIKSEKEMFEAVKEHYANCDLIFKAAAPADYRPTKTESEKIKKGDGNLTLELERTDDILKYLGANRVNGQFICGFAAETQNLEENAKRKLYSKNVDMIVANNVKAENAVFGSDNNEVTLITRDFSRPMPQMRKEELAHQIIDTALRQMG